MSLMPLGTQGIRSPGRPAPPPPPPPPEKLQAEPLRRVDSSSSDSSVESQATAIPAEKPQQLYQSAKQGARQNQIKSRSDEAAYGSASASQNFSRPTPVRVQFNAPRSGNTSPSAGPGQNRHLQTTQHGQGFFEPSLPTTSASGQPQAHGLSASRAAAQAAMQQQSSQQLLRQRSQTVGNVEAPAGASSVTFHSKPSTPTPGALEVYGVPTPTSARAAQSRNGSVSAFPGTAATAASAAYPRSLSSAGLPSPDRSAPVESKERKPKTESKSKMKLFSKPKSIGISRDKEAEKKDKPLPSPNKMGIYGPSPLPQIFTASTTSLADSVASGPASTIYSTRNNSTATLIPATNETNPTSDRHKHNFLSRQKLKLRDKDEGSSSAVNTKAAYPNPPAPLYTFTPSSPAPSTASFSKTGLDLRHGGRALREKKREEKASAAAAAAAAAANTIGFSSVGYSARDDESLYSTSDWPVPVHVGGGPGMTIPAASKAGSISLASGNVAGSYDSALQVNLQGQGLAGMTPDDAWPFLKAKLLVIFEGEDMRVTVEDCNTLLLYV
ncbi:MAG: hypothetical protein M1815_005503 [Lichina confinis]|nr:MAG: hypothetical protein M1815_005503 [Lichina confinis]